MPSAGQTLQWAVIALLGLAVVMVSSAGAVLGANDGAWYAPINPRAVVYAALAIGVMFLVAHTFDAQAVFRRMGLINPVVWLMLLSIVLCAIVLIPGMGRNVNGASRWMYLGPRSWGLSFQPSELAKWSLAATLAWWGARQGACLRHFWKGLLPALCIIALICGLIIIEDLGTAVLLGAVGLILLAAAGAKLWHLGLVMLPGLAAVGGMIWISDYRRQRLLAFLDPFADPEKIGYHMIQSQIAIAGGQITGRGLGNGLQKFGYLPEDTTDFLFAIVCEEMGVAGAVMVIGLYLLILWAVYGIVRDCRHNFARLLALGVGLTIGLQGIMNIAVVTGMMPPKGIALPLLSYGGTGWVMTAAAIGALAAIDRKNQRDLLGSAAAGDEPLPPLSVSAAQA